MRSCDVVVCLKIVKGLSVIYMIAVSDSASDHSLSLNFSLLSSLSKWLQVFFSSSSSAHALRSSLPPSQQCAVHPIASMPLHSSYLQFLPLICALLLSYSVLFPSLLSRPSCSHSMGLFGMTRNSTLYMLTGRE